MLQVKLNAGIIEKYWSSLKWEYIFKKYRSGNREREWQTDAETAIHKHKDRKLRGEWEGIYCGKWV